ncbi:hypothetical protein IIA15_03315 [candidate division TA06 bacterium]|nr:hypothetical protein [candidate division TA06 bacterium]
MSFVDFSLIAADSDSSVIPNPGLTPRARFSLCPTHGRAGQACFGFTLKVLPEGISK